MDGRGGGCLLVSDSVAVAEVGCADVTHRLLFRRVSTEKRIRFRAAQVEVRSLQFEFLGSVRLRSRFIDQLAILSPSELELPTGNFPATLEMAPGFC